jgi:hypothetical protein
MLERIVTAINQSSMAEARSWSSVWESSPELSRAPVWNGIVRKTSRVGEWANDTAVEFAALISALLAPAVVSAYLIALWSITSDMGVAGEFMVDSGPFSNWIVWIAIAISLHLGASILRRHVRRD